MAKKMYGNFVKGVVDLDRGLLVVDAEMHTDEEQFLIENGSSQKNMSRGIDDIKIQKAILELVQEKVTND